jgi:hypothetical protein
MQDRIIISIKIANKYIKIVEKIKYLRMAIANQNCVHEEMRSKSI